MRSAHSRCSDAWMIISPSSIKRFMGKMAYNVHLKNVSKMDVAKVIFKDEYGRSNRKAIIRRFIEEARLTPAGASTYYQLLKTAK